MVHKGQARLILTIALALRVIFPASAQSTEQTDSLVRLTKARSLELIEKNGNKYRKAIDATFLHNGTYLICDTALWNVDAKVINCQGSVRMIQDETILTSDRLDYFVDEDLAQFRGALVQLENKKANILRTRNLDYNTKDSTAIFRGGAAMRDQDGQVIESYEGTYETAGKMFTFTRDVNMFTDSVFVKTSELKYDGERGLVHFTRYIDFWKDGNMLSSDGGWYDRNRELFFFNGSVHGLTSTQETWSDSLYFYRAVNDVKMLGRAQVQDTSRNVVGMAERIFYQDSVSRITLNRKAAIAVRTEEKDKVDTLYLGADTLVYKAVKKCEIPQPVIELSGARLKEVLADAVTSYRRRAAEEAAAAAKTAREEADRRSGKLVGSKNAGGSSGGTVVPDSGDNENEVPDSGTSDESASSGEEQTIEVPDTTKIGFLYGIGHIKVFRKDLQAICDSLEYNDLDSIARMYNNPVVWNEIIRQYSADSLFVLTRQGHAERASLMSNAFIHTKESELYFNQIKSTDMMVFFDEDSQLKRFDALGGVNALFYLEENESIATVNRVETKMLSAYMKNGSVDRVHYFDSPKNDAFPVVQLPESEHRLKGYDWRPELRPKSRQDVSPLEIKKTQRAEYESHPKTTFYETDIYFPGYMQKVYKDIELSRIRKNAPKSEPVRVEMPDTSKSRVVADSLSIKPLKDTAQVVLDSLKADAASKIDSLLLGPPTKKELRETARALRIARRDARWAEKDAKDAEKAAKKAARQLRRKREMTRKLYLKQKKNEAEEQKWLQKYIEYYQKQKAKEDEKQLPTPAGSDTVLGDTGHSDGDSVLGGGSLPGPESRPGI